MTTMRNETAQVAPGLHYPGLCVRFICHDGAGNVLWQLRSKKTSSEQLRWDFGSGKVEHGETMSEALRRELLEEYGVEPVFHRFIGHSELLWEEQHWVMFDYLVLVSRDDVVIGEPEKIDRITWAPAYLAPRPLHHGALPCLNKYWVEFDALGKQ